MALQQFKTGRLPYREDDRDYLWRDVRPSGLVVPNRDDVAAVQAIPRPHGGWGMDFADWLLLNNGPSNAWPQGFAAAQGCGNCTIVDKAHAFMLSCKNAGRPIPTFTDKTAVADYSAATLQANGTAYDPQSGKGDTGLEMRVALSFTQAVGIKDEAGNVYKIGPYYKLDPENPDEWWECLWVTERLHAGIWVPASMEQQVLAHQTMTWNPNNATNEGGHNILIAGHPTRGIWTGVQWGMRTPGTEEFWSHTTEEMWTSIDLLDYNATTGESAEGYAEVDVEKYLATKVQAITG